MHATPAVATPSDAPRTTSRGVALPIVLMFLLIITIAAAFGVRRATLSEGITRNQLDYEVARQAAEAALRDGERDLFPVFAGKPADAACDRSPDRPLGSRLLPNLWTPACRKGQCWSTNSLAASDYATATNPQPWWPASKDGLWGDNEAVPANCIFDGGIPLGTFTGTPDINGVARQPEYMLELIERTSGESLIRVTARGFGADISTEVVLQTYIKPPGK